MTVAVTKNGRIIHVGNSGIEGDGVRLGEDLSDGDGEGDAEGADFAGVA